MVSVFLYLRALRNGCSESFDARHVRYPFSTTAVPVSSEIVAADVQRRQCPTGRDGKQNIRGDGAQNISKGDGEQTSRGIGSWEQAWNSIWDIGLLLAALRWNRQQLMQWFAHQFGSRLATWRAPSGPSFSPARSRLVSFPLSQRSSRALASLFIALRRRLLAQPADPHARPDEVGLHAATTHPPPVQGRLDQELPRRLHRGHGLRRRGGVGPG